MLSPPALLKVRPKAPEAVGVKVSEYVVHGELLASGFSDSVAEPKLTSRFSLPPRWLPAMSK